MQIESKPTGTEIAAWVLAAVGLFLVMRLGLLAALFAGLLVNALVHMMAPALTRSLGVQKAKLYAVGLLAAVVVLLLALAGFALDSFLRSESGSFPVLLQKMADIIAAARQDLPQWMQVSLPYGVDELQQRLIELMHEHSARARGLGEEAGRTAVHILVGMIIGAMVATWDTAFPNQHAPLTAALNGRMQRLADAFRRIVFAQVRIAALNTLFTALFLLVALPLAGVHLPLRKTMILVTFFAGLLPVLGNLISNVVIVVIALSQSFAVAAAALIFLIVIHKLEYFLNARIIGARIDARAWELLTAMLLFEAVWGLPGVVAAPVFYAYLKRELADRGLV
jgi:predicted PurR-regulated permease PerM